MIYAPKNIFWRHLAKTNPGKLLMKGRLTIMAPFPKNVNQRNNIFFRFVVQNRRKTYPVTMDPTVYPKKPAVHTRLIVSVKKQALKGIFIKIKCLKIGVIKKNGRTQICSPEYKKLWIISYESIYQIIQWTWCLFHIYVRLFSTSEYVVCTVVQVPSQQACSQ